MGGSPLCNDSVRSVKEFRRKAVTAKCWPTIPEISPQITFSVEDAEVVHMPHNDPLLVDISISDCTGTKVLVETGSSVDLIFKSTFIKMGISLDNMTPSARSLTGINGSTETMLGTICLRVYAEGVTKNVKFSVIDVRAPYNAILGTPWLHSMKAVPSTYHQCVKFPGNDGQITTLRGNQAAARDLLVAEVKNQSRLSTSTQSLHRHRSFILLTRRLSKCPSTAAATPKQSKLARTFLTRRKTRSFSFLGTMHRRSLGLLLT
ncbi:hypothetical protein Bca4012_038282 [Brassica carinata]